LKQLGTDKLGERKVDVIKISKFVDYIANIMEKIIEDNIINIRKLCQTYLVKELYVFGSAASEKMDQNSDIDFLISFQNIPAVQYADNYFSIHYELEGFFGRKIDLLTENSLSNPYFIQSIEKTKKLLYAA